MISLILLKSLSFYASLLSPFPPFFVYYSLSLSLCYVKFVALQLSLFVFISLFVSLSTFPTSFSFTSNPLLFLPSSCFSSYSLRTSFYLCLFLAFYIPLSPAPRYSITLPLRIYFSSCISFLFSPHLYRFS